MTRLRLFSVAEANDLLPQVRSLLARVRVRLDELRATAARVGLLDDGDARPVDRCDRAVPPTYFAAVERLAAANQGFSDLGIQLKDADLGLIDFPARSGAEIVLLCWREGEDEVGWFHSVEAGLAGRKPVAELEPPAT